jgi:hypothetical protein
VLEPVETDRLHHQVRDEPAVRDIVASTEESTGASIVRPRPFGRTLSVERNLVVVLVQPGVERFEIGVELTHQGRGTDSGEIFGRVRIELVRVGDFQGAGTRERRG